MNEKQVFGLALGLEGTPWSVTDIRFDPALRRLDIDLDFPPGSCFVHPDTGQSSPVYDTLQRRAFGWQAHRTVRALRKSRRAWCGWR